MKRTMSICLFTVILAVCFVGGIFLWRNTEGNSIKNDELAERTEQMTETQEAELAESMYVQETYRYFLIEENGVLVVYEQDRETILMETNISLHGVDEATHRLLQEGIWLTDEKELYDFLESYSS